VTLKPRRAEHPFGYNPGDEADGQVVDHIGGSARG
jgi:hypothetical protein